MARDGGLYDCRDRHQIPHQRRHRRQGADAVSGFTIRPTGTPSLDPEQSFGYDAGIDQSLFNGRATVSLTGFSNKFSNLIDFVSDGPGVPVPS